jgi:hypothetical protein
MFLFATALGMASADAGVAQAMGSDQAEDEDGPAQRNP